MREHNETPASGKILITRLFSPLHWNHKDLNDFQDSAILYGWVLMNGELGPNAYHFITRHMLRGPMCLRLKKWRLAVAVQLQKRRVTWQVHTLLDILSNQTYKMSIITAVQPPNFSWRDCIVAAESKRSPKQIKWKDFKFGREDLWRTNISNKTQAHHTAFHLSMIALQSWRRASGDDCLLWWWLLSKSGAAANNCLLISKLVPQPCYPLLWE